MLSCEFIKPKSLENAVYALEAALAGGGNARILAGGTDLVLALRERTARADMLIDISDIPEINGIRIDDAAGVLHIGAACSFSKIENHPDVLRHCPMLAQAAASVGAPTIRSRATIGGNVANAAAAADSIPVLLSADATARIVSAEGERTASVCDIITGCNQNILQKGDIIAEFLIPSASGKFCDFEKIGRRRALAISRINFGIILDINDESLISSAAVAVGAVGKTAYRVEEIERFLSGKELNRPLIDESCFRMDEIVARNLCGRKTTPYKRKIASAVLRRALNRALED